MSADVLLGDVVQRMRDALEEAVVVTDPADRVIALREVRMDLERLLGVADTYLADTDLAREAAALDTARNAMAARENAEIREEMLRRELATPEQLDAVGYVSHDTLDEWAESGKLQEALSELTEAFGLALLKGTAFERMVRRGTGGKFRDKPGVVAGPKGRGGKKLKDDGPSRPDTVEDVHAASVLPTDRKGPAVAHQPTSRLEDVAVRQPKRAHAVKPVRTLKGKRGGVKGRKYDVYDTPDMPQTTGGGRGEIHHGGELDSLPHSISVPQLKHDRKARGDTDAAKRKANREAHAADVKAARKAGDKPYVTEEVDGKKVTRSGYEEAARIDAIPPEQYKEGGKKKMFDERSAKLEKRVQGEVTKAKKQGRLDREGGVTGATGTLTTAEAHFNQAGSISQKALLTFANEAATQPTTVERYRNKDGSYTLSRQVLHARIADACLRKRNKDKSLSFTNEYLPAQDQPMVLFSGGGYAAGKGTILNKLMAEGTGSPAEGKYPPDAMVLDPDVIKAELPEFADALGTDPEANLLTYEEAWDIAQMVQKQAQEAQVNVVVDGISNTSPEEMIARVESFVDAGYVDPVVNYVTIPTDEAITRAHARVEGAKTDADRRFIPEIIMRAVHRDVSATVPKFMEKAADLGIIVNVYNTNQGKDPVTGDWAPAKRLATTDKGKFEIKDNAGWAEFKAKAQEGIAGVDEGGAKPHDPSAVAPVELAMPDALEADLLEVNKHIGGEGKPPPALKTYPEAQSAAEAALPAFLDLVDRGEGLGAEIGAEVHEDFGEAVTSIAARPDVPHIMLAPVKGESRASEKAGNKHGGDFGQLNDMVRATVLVPNQADVRELVEALESDAVGQDWTITGENKMVRQEGIGHSPGPTSAGYSDVQLVLQLPDGFKTELQVNSNAMFDAKDGTAQGFDDPVAREVLSRRLPAKADVEHLNGHVLFEAIRSLAEEADAENRNLTPDEQDDLNILDTASQTVYQQAWDVALGAPRTRFKARAGTVQDYAA